MKKSVKSKKKSKAKVEPKAIEIPLPNCALGYTWAEINSILTKSETKKFNEWIRGQTLAIEEGIQYVYPWDFDRFIFLVRHGIETYWD